MPEDQRIVLDFFGSTEPPVRLTALRPLSQTSNAPPEPLSAHADRDKLRQILGALLDNAVKFSPDGGTVTVVARRNSAATVEVAVADEGVGIPQAENERIFRKFYRGGETASGTGLGLFIAQELVSAMGGRISVESVEGKGSRFWFELPLAAAAVEGERARV